MVAAGLAFATSLGVLTVVAPGVDAQSPGPVLRVGANVRVGASQQILRGRDAPGLAFNPADARHIVETEVDPRSGQCHYNVSFDAGATWTGGTLRAPADFGSSPCLNFDKGGYLRMDGGVAFGSGQNVYVTFSAFRSSAEGDSVLVARSTDGGRNFAEAQVVIVGGANIEPYYIRPKLGVQRRPSGDRVVVESWGLTTQPPATFEAQQRRIVVAVSENSGATWGTPVDVQPADQAAREISAPTIAPDGTIYLAWRTQRNAANGFPAGTQSDDYLSKSIDGGRTWTNSVVRQLAASSGSNHPRLGIDPRNGTLYYVDNEAQVAGDPNVWLQRSTDGGTTWTAPQRVNDDSGAPVSQNTVNISVAPDGRVDIIWSDRRFSYGGTGYADTFLASSVDGGRTFTNKRVSDRLINLSTGLSSVGTTSFFAPAVASPSNGEVLVAWADARETNFETDNQDIYLSRVQVNPTGPPPVDSVPPAQPAGVSASLARLSYPGGSEKIAGNAVAPANRVVIVNDADVAGALAGSVLARANVAPVLASPAAGLTPEVSAEVRRLEPGGAFVIGDEGALSPTVVSDLIAAGVPATQVFRLSGSSTADTARRIAEVYLQFETGAVPARTVPKTAVIVDPASKEAASAGAMAAALRYPVLFAERDSLPGATSAALAALETTDTLVIGGPGTIADSVLRQLPNALRVGGADLYGTARAVAAEAANRGLPTNIAYVVDGQRPIDGALASAAVARLGGSLVLSPGGDPTAAGTSVDRSVVIRSFNGPGAGYRLVSSDGGVFAFGGAKFLGGLNNTRLAQPVVATATNPDGDGYWLVAADGGVFSFGSSAFHGSTGAIRLNRPIVSMAPTPSGKGYFLVASDGGVFAFGDAVFAGSTGAIRLNQPIVSMAVTPSGKGYFLVAADGGVFAFGDAVFRGSTGSIRLNQPIVAATATPSGRGYLLVASDGGVFAFGDGVFRGSTGAIKLNRPIVAATTTSTAGGYYLIASDGGVFAFGAAPFFGSTGAIKLAQPIVGAGL